MAAIACAEHGAQVRLHEAHRTLGGRARTSAPPFVAHQGPHVLYDDGPLWAWLHQRDLVGPTAHVPLRALGGIRFRWRGRLRRRPPVGMLRMVAQRRRRAPVDQDFRSWAAERFGEQAASAAASYLGVVAFDHDPGRLSAAFCWERLLRVTAVPPRARYVLGGWGDAGAPRGASQDAQRPHRAWLAGGLPARAAGDRGDLAGVGREAAGRHQPCLESGRTVLLDLGLQRRRGDPFIVADLDEAGWAERFSAPDLSLAPPGCSLVQAQLPLRPRERGADGLQRLEHLLDLGYAGWHERQLLRRHGIAAGRSGALDLPGRTWRDRPPVDRGGGVFLIGDMVAAPGLLSEVSFTSAIQASRAALGLQRLPMPVGSHT